MAGSTLLNTVFSLRKTTPIENKTQTLTEIANRFQEFSLNQPIDEFGLDYEREERALAGLTQASVTNPYAPKAQKDSIDLLFNNSVLIGQVFTPNLGIDANEKPVEWYNSFSNGTVISNEGHVLTSWHVAKPEIFPDYRKIIVIDGQKNVYEANIIAFSERYDLALLKTNIKGEHKVFLADESVIPSGDKVFSGGLDLEGKVEFNISPFRITNKDEIRLNRFTSSGYFRGNQDYPTIGAEGTILANPVVTDTFSRGGYSGSLIIDTQGRIVGVTSMSNTNTTSASSATNIRKLITFYLNGLRETNKK